MNLAWRLSRHQELHPEELQEILITRQQIFIIEQQCIYLDADNLDALSLHLTGRDPSGKLVAYARLIPPGIKGKTTSFGRVLVVNTHRNTGLGKQLVTECIQRCLSLYPGIPIQISAQLELESFYQGLGFESLGQPYDDAGILHLDMILNLSAL